MLKHMKQCLENKKVTNNTSKQYTTHFRNYETKGSMIK